MSRARRNPRPPQPAALPDLSRRSVLRGAGLAGLGLGAAGLLGACGIEGAKQTAESCPSTDLSPKQREVFFSNWPEYIDVNDAGKMPSLMKFTKESGIAVTYNAEINDNNEFFAKIQNQMGNCEPIGRDIIVFTDWQAARCVNLGWLQKLDHANIPNIDANLVKNLKSPSWDPNRDYSAPWQTGITGIAYNAKYTGPVGSFEELMTRADLKGRVSVLSEMRDTMGFMLLMGGADPSDFSSDEWDSAVGKLEKFVGNGHIRRFTGNDYVDDLNSGDLLACEAWSGDVIAMQFDNPDIKWVVPEEGAMLWSDNMLVPNLADHKANAEALMDYYYEPTVAATLSAWVNYICPVEGAKEAMTKIDSSLVDNPLIFPDEEFLAQTVQFMPLDEIQQKQYDTDFSLAAGA